MCVLNAHILNRKVEINKMFHDNIIWKAEQILLGHGLKEANINGRRNFIREDDAEKSYLRLDEWGKCIQIEIAESYENALNGVYEDTDGVDIPISMLSPDEVKGLSDRYILSHNYTEYDFYSIFQMYVVLFYKEKCLIDRLEDLGFKRAFERDKYITVKGNLKCDIRYDEDISRVVCKITSENRSLRREYDYEQGRELCESVMADLEEFIKE